MVEVRDGAGPNSTLLGEVVFYPQSSAALSSPEDVQVNFTLTQVITSLFLSYPAVITGNGPTHDFFSTANQVTVWFYTDSSVSGKGFRANFTSGVNLGSPGELITREETVKMC